MRILLTGKTGQVGYQLERSLQGLGEVIALNSSQMNLAELDQVREVIRRVKPDLIVNPAAYTAVDLAEREPDVAMRINGDAPGVMAEEAKSLGAAMIHYSTDYVFDGSKQGAYTEGDSPNPVNVYGSSKLAGERAVQAAGIPYLILRTSWVYGMHGKNFLRTVMRLAQERDELRIVADQFGAPTWSRTIADTTAHIVARLQSTASDKNAGIEREIWQGHSGIYHLTAQGHTTWYGFTKAILNHPSILKKPAVTPIRSEEYPVPARRPANSVLSCARLIDTFCSLPEWEKALGLCQE
ncbi:MAG TPA: dTDP-4-dehydrorhamnose reductase [Burkholderiaceae bacterium]|nr:dTDP-4-dehydrorhamnose reductase [Burkholderiaceae bacterium]